MKSQNKALLRARAVAAISALYHNASISYPTDMHGRADDDFNSWLEFAVLDGVDYLQSGGAYGPDYAKTLAAACNAGRYHSERAQRYYVVKGMRAMRAERFDCGSVTGWKALEFAAAMCAASVPSLAAFKDRASERNHSMWEYIGQYGELYQYGRGGRTLAPDGLMQRDSPHTGYVDDMAAGAMVDLIVILESFNRYVRAWCKDVPAMWTDHCADIAAEERAEAAEVLHWASRDVMTEGGAHA